MIDHEANLIPVIYLDQNHWIEMLRASEELSDESVDRRVLKLLQNGVNAGRYTCILSGSHYHETWNRARKSSRHALAGLMCSLSKYTTMAPYQTVRLHENRSLLAQLRSSDGHLTYGVSAPREVVIGQGVNHAFSSTTGRFRFVANIASPDQPEGESVAPPEEFTAALREIQERAPEKYEWLSLAGFDEHPDVEGFELFTQRRRGQEFADFRTYFSTEMANRRKHDATNVRRFLLAEFADRIAEELAALASGSGLPIPAIESWRQANSIISSMPTCNTFFRLLQNRQRNRQKQWESNDLGDLQFLSVAVPYAEFVLTERQWSAIVRAEKLDSLYNSHVTHKRSDLLEALSAGWPYGADMCSE